MLPALQLEGILAAVVIPMSQQDQHRLPECIRMLLGLRVQSLHDLPVKSLADAILQDAFQNLGECRAALHACICASHAAHSHCVHMYIVYRTTARARTHIAPHQ